MVIDQVKILFAYTCFCYFLIIIIVICLSSQKLGNYIVMIFVENLRLLEQKRI